VKSQFKLDMLELKQPQPTVQVAALRLRLGCAAPAIEQASEKNKSEIQPNIVGEALTTGVQGAWRYCWRGVPPERPWNVLSSRYEFSVARRSLCE